MSSIVEGLAWSTACLPEGVPETGLETESWLWLGGDFGLRDGNRGFIGPADVLTRCRFFFMRIHFIPASLLVNPFCQKFH
jgi:hypothetical protein